MVAAVVSGIEIRSLLEYPPPVVDIPITRGEYMYDDIIAAASHFFTLSSSSCTLHYSQHSNCQRDGFPAWYSSVRTCILHHSFAFRLHGCEADCACSLDVPIV